MYDRGLFEGLHEFLELHCLLLVLLALRLGGQLLTHGFQLGGLLFLQLFQLLLELFQFVAGEAVCAAAAVASWLAFFSEASLPYFSMAASSLSRKYFRVT